MIQAELFTPMPRARKPDPATSHVAAQKAAGSANAHRQRIVAALRAKPGMTYREIAEATGLEPVAVGRRLIECERMGTARPGGEQTQGGRTMRTWWPAGAQ